MVSKKEILEKEKELDSMQEEPESHKPKTTLGEATGKFKIDDFTRALAECINQAQCAVVDPMAHAEIWKEELLELAKGKEPVSEDLERAAGDYEHNMWKAGHPEDTYNSSDIIKAVKFGAQWKEQQLMKKAVDATITIPYQNGYGGYSQIVDSKEALPFGEKVKVIVIKED